MTHEFFEGFWQATATPPYVRDSIVRFVAGMDPILPVLVPGEVVVNVYLADANDNPVDRVFHVGDLVVLRKVGIADMLFRLVGDLVFTEGARGGWAATGRMG